MKLTGKAKERFERWLLNETWDSKVIFFFTAFEIYGFFKSEKFYSLPFNMKFGVYVDFFDSEEIEIEVYCEHGAFGFQIFNSNAIISIGDYTRHEARTEAIEKANELLNKKIEIG